MNWFKRLFKGFTWGSDSFLRGGEIAIGGWSNVDGARGPAWENSAVWACCAWLIDTLPEAPLKVKRLGPAGEEVIPAHKVYDVLRRPTPWGYSWADALGAAGVSYRLDGNAYLRVMQDERSQFAGLEYLPHTAVTPKQRQDGTVYYEMYRGGRLEELDARQVVHVRMGIDPSDPLRGMSPIRAAMREVLTDNEASVYNNALLKNLGIMPLVFSPGSPDATFTMDDRDEIEKRLSSKFTGADRGKPAVFNAPMSIEQIGVTPEKLQVREMRRTPEERICAAFRLPAVVVGMGAGLDRSTYSNMAEAREAAVESCNGPMWARFASGLESKLLDLRYLSPGEFLEFDLSKVRALQEDEDRKHARARDNYAKGIWKRSEARTYTGLEADATDDVYMTDLAAQQAEGAMLAKAARESGRRRELYESLDVRP